jgi:transcription elongation factor Elf1
MTAKVRQVGGGYTVYGGEFNCPHCGHVNSAWFPWDSRAPQVVCCDNEAGGCDTWFAVTAKVTITVEPTARKIEGISPSRETIDAWGRGDA